MQLYITVLLFNVMMFCICQVFLPVSLSVLCVSLPVQWTLQRPCTGDVLAVHSGKSVMKIMTLMVHVGIYSFTSSLR